MSMLILGAQRTYQERQAARREEEGECWAVLYISAKRHPHAVKLGRAGGERCPRPPPRLPVRPGRPPEPQKRAGTTSRPRCRTPTLAPAARGLGPNSDLVGVPNKGLNLLLIPRCATALASQTTPRQMPLMLRSREIVSGSARNTLHRRVIWSRNVRYTSSATCCPFVRCDVN